MITLSTVPLVVMSPSQLDGCEAYRGGSEVEVVLFTARLVHFMARVVHAGGRKAQTAR